MIEATKKRVLLIDDDTSLLVTLGDFLKFEGYDVITADSGESGLVVLENQTPDLIVLDMSMPGMGGIGFLKAISTPEGKPNYPVLVLTARANMADFFATVEVDGFVAKPCEPQDLLLEVSRIIFLRRGPGLDTMASAKGGRVLIGEDEEPVRTAIVNAFIRAGYAAEGVARGAELIERAVMEKPDVVIIKLILERMNGDTVATILGDMPATSGVPVLLYDDSGSGVSAKKYRVSGPTIRRFVTSNDPATLVAALRDLQDQDAG